jgi:CHAT domain-containing protein
MSKIKRWLLTMLTVSGLLLGLSGTAAAQDQEAKLGEVERLNEQVFELYDAARYAEAIPLAERALEIREKVLGPQHPDVATSLNYLAHLYYAQGDYGRAAPLFQRALAIREKALGPEHPDVAQSLNSLAVLYGDQGDFGRAAPLLQRALAIYEKELGPEHPDVAQSLNNLAVLYQDQGDYGRAAPLYQRALAIYEKALGPWHPNVATLLNNLAALYEAKEDFVRAVQFQMRGNDVEEYNLALILSTGSEQQKQLFLNTLSDEAQATVSLHVRSAPTNVQAAQLALTTILRRKGRVLDAMTDQLAALRRRATPEDQKLLDRLADVQSHLATLQISGGGKFTLEARRAEIARLETEQERLEDAISRSSAEFRAAGQPVTLDAVHQALPADAALVELFIYKPFNAKAKSPAERYGTLRYVAYLLLRTDDAPQFVELGEAATIEAEVERLRAALKDPKRADVQTIARVVDERVMRPVRKLLGATRQIFLSPDGALNLIPFATLVDENGKYLVENYSLTYLTSGRDLLRLAVQGESRSVPSVLADPLYDMTGPRSANRQATQRATPNDGNPQSMDFTLRNYRPLPGTAEEAAALAKVMPNAQVLTQGKATEGALKQVRSPCVLHIATHGFFLADQPQESPTGPTLRGTVDTLSNPSPLPARWENPLLRSGLILAGVKQAQSGAGEDGVLTALEAAGLALWGTKLVVLSACETGLGEVRNGAGVYGLRRALVLAGSETQVMSLWKVSDTGTRDLMTAYYARLQAGEGRTEALRQVQLAMLRGRLLPGASRQQIRQRETVETSETPSTKDYRHPYYWAAFVPSGDWRSMSCKEVRPQ